jgi:hypothetical protein
VLVLPEAHETGGQRLAGPHAHQQPDAGLGDGQVQQGDRHLVEQLPVVDREQDVALAGPHPHTGQRRVQQVVALVGLLGGRQQVGERPERDLAGRLGGPDPLDGHAAGAAGLDRLGHEPGLADAGVAEHGDTPGPAVGAEQAEEVSQLGVTPDQRPAIDHDGIVARADAGIRRCYGSACACRRVA